MNHHAFELPDETHCERLAAKLAAALLAPATLTFQGDIGAGKTTFIRAMLRALGVSGAIKSPTFSLVESYECRGLHIHHFDLYRIEEESGLEYLGFRDYFTSRAVCCIEWPERAGTQLEADLRIILTIKGSGRFMTVEAGSPTGEAMLRCLADQS